MTQHSISQTFKNRPGFVSVPTPTRLQSPGFTFEIHTGRLYDGTGKLVADGLYSGHGLGLNNPDLQAERGVGPLPVGVYRVGPLQDGGRLGPNVMRLTQTFGVSYGRSGFFIHGASAVHPAFSSDGCIIAPPGLRERIDAQCGPDRLLAVRA